LAANNASGWLTLAEIVPFHAPNDKDPATEKTATNVFFLKSAGSHKSAAARAAVSRQQNRSAS
jgi:hypothetical protein